jgi:tRNA 2-selenouridine synthase
VLRGDHPVVDVRTPKEFEEFRIPGAINLPLFSNEERVKVGTTYTRQSKEAAKELGIHLISDKLPRIYRLFREIFEQDGKSIYVHCWRGGMRSLSIVSFMNSLGVPCAQVDGGIRSFRTRIVSDLERFSENAPSFIVLEGLTGTRKTDILEYLEKDGYPVINLEAMAGHRGSAFGAIGMSRNSQKQFECLLWQRLNALKDASSFIIEAESKRIGNILLPDFIMKGKQAGSRIRLNYPFQKRVKALHDEYQPQNHNDEVQRAILRIKKRLRPEVRNELEEVTASKNYFKLISILLEHYYDPMYRFSSKQYDTSVNEIIMETLEEGIEKVKHAINELSNQK